MCEFASLWVCALGLVIAGVLAALPWLEPRGKVFGVSGLSEQGMLAVGGYKRRYLAWVLGSALVCIGLCALGVWFDFGELGSFWLMMASCLLPVAVSFWLCVRYHARVLEVSFEAGGAGGAGGNETSLAFAEVGGGEARFSGAISAWWGAVLLLPVAVSLLFGLSFYGSFLDALPIHAGVDGVVSYVAKSPVSALMPVWINLFLACILWVSLVVIGKSKRPCDPKHPELSLWAYGRFARAQSIAIVVVGLLVEVTLSWSLFSCFLGAMSLWGAFVVMLCVCLVIVAGVVVLGVVYGQNGSRLLSRELARSGGDSRVSFDNADNASWKGGFFYFNPNDPSVILPKRFGMGWTVNWARPSAWVALGCVVAVVVACVVCAVFSGM